MLTFEIKSTPNRTDADVQSVNRGLGVFNDSIVGGKLQPLVVIARNDVKEVIGGLLGGTWAGWLQVEVLWVREDYRHQGCGAHLMELAESEAARRGCKNAYLTTFSFQARPFYERLGYRVAGSIPGYPPGHEFFFMVKRDLSDDND